MIEPIKFGTDGWRAVIADEFTVPNVRRVTQATCDWVRRHLKSRLMVIGYDHRFFSKRFARVAAEVALANKFKVEFSKSPLSSPALSFTVRSKKASIGIMLTASHNPYYFNGFKLKGAHGGSVKESVTQEIEAGLDTHDVQILKEEPKFVDFIPPYLSHLKKVVNARACSKLKHVVVFDAMHGPGGHLIEKLTGNNKCIHVLRSNEDPLFGGINPEPIEENLSLLKQEVLNKKASVGIAVDGDADRIGLVDEKGHYLPPHTVMPLLLLHLIKNRKLKGKVVQTVSMGYLPQRIATHFKMPFDEVSVGFKYIAERMEKEKVLLGGEESGGYGVGLWTPERDGLLCALLIIEMLAKEKKPLSVIVADLESQFGRSKFKRVDFHLYQSEDKSQWTQRLLSNINGKIGNFNIKHINSSDGIKIITEDDSWVLMRPSGTEPLIRTYAEGPSDETVNALLEEADKLVHIPPPSLKKEAKKAKRSRARRNR